jgi:predicted peptidase
MKKTAKSITIAGLLLAMAATALSGCGRTGGTAGTAGASTEAAGTQTAAQETSGGAANVKVYTINHSYGDGQKVSNVVLEFEEEIDPDSISTESFEVVDRTITDVHVNDECDVTEENKAGNYVVLDLEIQPAVLNDQFASDGRAVNDQIIDSASVYIRKDIKTAGGEVISAGDTEYASDAGDGGIMGNDAVKTPDMDKFEDNHFYNDPMTGTVLHYNFYAPEGYEDSGEEYPLVLFIPDAGAVSSDWEKVLQQGNGGTIWTSDDWQADNPCFVVTMIYEDKYINDYWEYYDGYLYGTINLLKQLVEDYPIDNDRIYSTGQSMGCMATMVMMREEPGLIDAGYLMAGQWDPEDIKDIYDENILFLVSEDDPANNKLTADEEMWQSMGAVTADSNISVLNTEEERAQIVDDLVSQDANMYFLRITSQEGSLDGDGNAMAGSHRMTWRLGYDLPGVMEWLFAQSGSGK